MAAPSLAVFKARLDGALSNLGWWKMSLLMAEGLEPNDLSGPFQPLPFYGSMICISAGFLTAPEAAGEALPQRRDVTVGSVLQNPHEGPQRR